MAFLAPLLHLAAQDGLDDVETKCVHKYCYVRATTEHLGLDAKVDVNAYCSLIIFLPTFVFFTSTLISLATTGLPFF